MHLNALFSANRTFDSGAFVTTLSAFIDCWVNGSQKASPTAEALLYNNLLKPTLLLLNSITNSKSEQLAKF
ncbi:hypothetical protein T4A_10069 [Trichinella pseudospiralis]|uniref:Uncharacterized protein n=1 Tax=Trichinella pseudospiralis TaxID=6337 RepID=A0A0V1DYK1_TRIPS|nr:hypothetical protein T4A_10069 [Trichinella pseudospiralis]